MLLNINKGVFVSAYEQKYLSVFLESQKKCLLKKLLIASWESYKHIIQTHQNSLSLFQEANKP